MGGILIRRLLTGIVTLIFLLTLVFFLVRLAGNPVEVLAGPEARPEQVEEVRRRLGLDKPVLEQFEIYLRGMLRGDMGTSWRTNQPVSEMIFERVPATVQLGMVGIALATLIAVPAGIISASKPGSLTDDDLPFWETLASGSPDIVTVEHLKHC